MVFNRNQLLKVLHDAFTSMKFKLFHLSHQQHSLCLNFHLDFYYEETQIQSMICDLNCQIKSSEESKVVHYELKSKDLSEQRIELDKGSDFAKCKHYIDIFNFNWIKLSIY